MSTLLSVLQVLLGLHTVIGAVWKFSNSEQAVPSLKALPHSVWRTLSGIELLCAAGLILPVFIQAPAIVAPVAAAGVAAEMLVFSGLHLRSGVVKHGEMIYWLVVAAISAVITYGKLA